MSLYHDKNQTSIYSFLQRNHWLYHFVSIFIYFLLFELWWLYVAYILHFFAHVMITMVIKVINSPNGLLSFSVSGQLKLQKIHCFWSQLMVIHNLFGHFKLTRMAWTRYLFNEVTILITNVKLFMILSMIRMYLIIDVSIL